MLSGVLVATTVVQALAGIPDPAYSKNMTLYHINPLNVSGIENMDLGDAAGDVFFDITALIGPWVCPSPYGQCDNREVIGPNIGLKKVVVEFDTRHGAYGACNICVNGTDPMNKSRSCKGDEYVCDCKDTSSFPPKAQDCSVQVGFENTTNFFGPKGIGQFCPQRNRTNPSSVCWNGNSAEKLGGLWYSPTTLGKCTQDDKPCSWRLLSVEKTITRDCHLNAWHSVVEKHMEPGCIDSCADSGMGQARNTSSKCWVKCWIDAALGKDAGSSPLKPEDGMSKEALVGAWLAPFASDDPSKGGCPNVPEMSSIIV